MRDLYLNDNCLANLQPRKKEEEKEKDNEGVAIRVLEKEETIEQCDFG